MDARTSSQFRVCFLVYLTVLSDLLNYKESNKRMFMKINYDGVENNSCELYMSWDVTTAFSFHYIYIYLFIWKLLGHKYACLVSPYIIPL